MTSPAGSVARWLVGSRAESRLAGAALLILRLHVGVTLARSGFGGLPPSEEFIGMVAGMGFPSPTFFAWCAMLSEFIGGTLLALGVLTRPAAALGAGTMAVAAFGFHRATPIVQMEMAQLYLWTLVYFIAAGGGDYAFDRVIRRALPRGGRASEAD